MFKKSIILILLLLTITSMSQARKIGSVNLPNTILLGEEQLILNGAGFRKKFFKKVYAGGLYLSKKENNAHNIINADEPMMIRMHFVYDGIDGNKLINAWNEGFDKATNGDTSSIKEEIERFNSFFIQKARKGDIYHIIYQPKEGVRVDIKGKRMGTIKGLDFKKAVFAIWLGERPAQKSLKKEMLGK
ncbi:MAG: chalcone isomerase family protein [Thermodesulfobacteriota bacterium]|nr:chalcone isomerase family protein [Thermodesulfobacteriota bacterium]